MPSHKVWRAAAFSLPCVLLVACGGGGGGSQGAEGAGSSSVDYSVTVAVSGNGSADPVGAVQVKHGSTMAITLVPDSGYGVGTASGCGGSLEGDVYTTGAITGDCSVSVVYDPLHTVTIAAAGNGSTNPSTSVQVVEGGSTDITLIPDADYLVGTAGGCDGSLTGDVYTTGTIMGSCTVTVSFKSLQPITLNDTGITECGDYAFSPYSGTDNNDLDCAGVGASSAGAGTDGEGDPVPAGQDATYGRDAQMAAGSLVKQGGGRAGFDFTKLDSVGNPLNAGASSWDCVRDNVTGLIWEVKVDDAAHLRHKDHLYTWYNADSSTNAGNAGTEDGGYCANGSGCDTEKFVSDVNSAALCGQNDWRLPTFQELMSIVDYGPSYPTIDATYFPNTLTRGYWTSSLVWDGSAAWTVDFHGGYVDYRGKDIANRVRLVRGGQ